MDPISDSVVRQEHIVPQPRHVINGRVSAEPKYCHKLTNGQPCFGPRAAAQNCSANNSGTTHMLKRSWTRNGVGGGIWWSSSGRKRHTVNEMNTTHPCNQSSQNDWIAMQRTDTEAGTWQGYEQIKARLPHCPTLSAKDVFERLHPVHPLSCAAENEAMMGSDFSKGMASTSRE